MTDEQAPERGPGDNPEPDATPAPPVMAAYTPPPVAPPAMPQPAVAWAAPPVAVAAAGGRTTLAAIAGVVLIVLGILGGLVGLLITVLGGAFAKNLPLGEIPELEGADAGAFVGGMVAFLGIVILLYSLVYFFGGIGVLRSRGWGRVMGIVVGILSGLVWLSGFTNAGAIESADTGSSIVFSLVLLIAHAYIVVVLIAFWRTKTQTT